MVIMEQSEKINNNGKIDEKRIRKKEIIEPRVLLLTNSIYPDEFGGIPISMFQIYNQFQKNNQNLLVIKLTSKKKKRNNPVAKIKSYISPRMSIFDGDYEKKNIKKKFSEKIKDIPEYIRFLKYIKKIYSKKKNKEYKKYNNKKKKYLYQLGKQIFLHRFIFLPEIERIIEEKEINLILIGSMFHNHFLGSYLIYKLKKKGIIIVHGADILNKKFSEDPERLGYDAVITRTKYVKNLVLKEYNYNQEKIFIVPDGITTEHFNSNLAYNESRNILNISNDTFQVISVGRLVYRKAFDLVLKAIKNIIERIDKKIYSINKKIKYIIVGDGPEKDYLNNLISSYKLQDYVEIKSKLSNEERDLWLSASDVFIMTPRENNRQGQEDIEGFGIVYLEANYMGVPAIGAKTGGVPEAIEDGVSGLLINVEDTEDLIDKILLLIDKPEYREKLSRLGKERVNKYFLWDIIYEKYKTIFTNIINE